jgi:Protein of unknown function (DUF1353)
MATPATPTPSQPTWTPWCVTSVPQFQVADNDGKVSMVQVGRKDFEILTDFRFVDDAATEDLRRKLESRGVPLSEIDSVIQDATTFLAPGGPTDLASIPRFMRWFDDTYGRHTLAAIIHDRLIQSDQPNAGALRSDSLSDRLFRHMLQAAGLPIFKCWILWCAVALRTRWFAGGFRRLTLVVWILLAACGLTLFVYSVATWSPWLLLVSIVMPAVVAPLWGSQFGASLVGAAAVPWVLPPAMFCAVGYLIYKLLELIIDRVAAGLKH